MRIISFGLRCSAVRACILIGMSIAVHGCNQSHGNDLFSSSSDVPPASALGAQPTFGPGVSLATSPPPISGGTLAIAPDGVTAFASDPDRDRVYVVDLTARVVRRTIQLLPHDEPGRAAVDSMGRAYVALRGGGALLTVEPQSGATERRPVCSAPRGVAYDAAKDSVLVACMDGTLARFPVKTGAATARKMVERDLRDIVVRKDGGLFLSTFRHAGLLHTDGAGNVIERAASPDVANLMWRMVALNLGDGEERVLAAAQRPKGEKVSVSPGAYGGTATAACPEGGIVAGHMVVGGGPVTVLQSLQVMPRVVLPVDLVTDGTVMVVISAGAGHTPSAPQLFEQAVAASGKVGEGSCAQPRTGTTPGQPIAVAFDGAGELIVQSREPAALYVMTPDHARVWKTIELGGDSREDTGHAVFHSDSGSGVACASCHAEGGEDGHTWDFDTLGPRRTPSLRGTLAHTEPFHWDGSQKDMGDILTHVFEERMSGPQLGDSQVSAVTHWVYGIPAPPPLRAVDDAVTRGQALFESHGCPGCHSGPMLTNNQTVDVGTGAAFQVPSLKGVGWRDPFLHDGCAADLRERFGPCGGGQHGNTADLDPVGVSDLAAYLETL